MARIDLTKKGRRPKMRKIAEFSVNYYGRGSVVDILRGNQNENGLEMYDITVSDGTETVGSMMIQEDGNGGFNVRYEKR